MQPVAVALDKLQGEKAAYFGHILPTLHMLQTKLKAMWHKILTHCEPLVVALLEGMDRRFEKELKLSGASSDKSPNSTNPYVRYFSSCAIVTLSLRRAVFPIVDFKKMS